MKGKKLKRIVSFMMAFMMLFAFSVTAFAAETMDLEEKYSNDEIIIDTRGANPDSATIEPWGTVKLYYDNNIPFPFSLHVSTASSASQGAVIVSVVHTEDPNMELSKDWVMGVNDEATWNVIGLAGRYAIQISNHSDWAVNVKIW